MAGVLYITHARKPVERIEVTKGIDPKSLVSMAYLDDPTVMGYYYDPNPSLGLSEWHCYWFERNGRKARSFHEVNLPKDIKAMRLIGL